MHQMIDTIMTITEDKNIHNNTKERYYNAPFCYFFINDSSFIK